jgi:hypothetical protein
MPSPFPGMDPYLENTDFWQGFHNRFMTYLADEIQPHLPPNYVATLEMRVYYEGGAGDDVGVAVRIPDIDLVRTGPSSGWGQPGRADVEIRGQMVDVDPVEFREAHILIRDISAGELVTSVELLSPTNKRPGEGRDLYRVKQSEMVVAGVNLVEIDLLRSGAHTIYPSAESIAHLAPFHYIASVHRVRDALRCEVFTWTVRQALPVIPIPLAVEDREVDADLGRVFSEAYDKGRFARLLNYGSRPRPPLAAEDAEWAGSLLKGAGLGGDSVV